MTYGFIAYSDSGSLVASSDSFNYELSQRVVSGSRVGNVTTYSITAVPFPLVFVELPVGGSAGILQVSGTTVKIIGNGNYPIRVYRRMTPATGYGLAVYNASQELTFKASGTALNVATSSSLGIGGTVSSVGEAVSYASVASRTTKSVSTSGPTPYLNNYVYEFSSGCAVYAYGSWYSDYVKPSMSTWNLSATWTITNWAVHRSVVVRTGSGFSFAWEVHTSGYFKIPAISATLVKTYFAALLNGGVYQTNANYAYVYTKHANGALNTVTAIQDQLNIGGNPTLISRQSRIASSGGVTINGFQVSTNPASPAPSLPPSDPVFVGYYTGTFPYENAETRGGAGTILVA